MNNPYFNPYQGGLYQPPFSMPNNRLQQPAQSNGIVWVQGEEGAKAYNMVPFGGTVLLMDSEGSRFYLKSTDQSGMPLPLRVFEFTEITQDKPTVENPAVDYVTRVEFDDLMNKVDALAEKSSRSTRKKEVVDVE